MLMQMAWIIAIIGTISEVLLVHKIKYVDKLYTKGSHLFWIKAWHVDGVIWNTIGSFGLSYIQGKMFGATGLVIAVGGALGSGVSMMYFELEKWIQKTYHHETVLKFIKAQIPEIQASLARGLVLARDVWKFIHFCLMVITFPFWAKRWAKSKWETVRTNYQHPSFTLKKGVTP